MIRLAVVAALALAPLARAHTAPALDGSYRVETVVTGEDTLAFPDAMAREGKELVWGRWRWTFGENELTLASEAFYLDDTERRDKGRTTIEESRYAHCATEITVEVGWVGHDLLLPTQLQAESRFGQFDRRDRELSVHDCNVRLNGVSSLRRVANAPGAPRDAVTLANPSRGLTFVLVPDDGEPNLRDLVDR